MIESVTPGEYEFGILYWLLCIMYYGIFFSEWARDILQSFWNDKKDAPHQNLIDDHRSAIYD